MFSTSTAAETESSATPAEARPAEEAAGGPSDWDAVDRARHRRERAGKAVPLLMAITVLGLGYGSLPFIEGLVLENHHPPALRRGLARALGGRGWAVIKAKAKPQPEIIKPRPRMSFDDVPQHGGSLRGRRGLTLDVVIVLEAPREDAFTVGTVDAATNVMVMQEKGRWIQVAAQVGGELIMGWTPRGRISVMP